MRILKTLTGYEVEHLSNRAFRLMAVVFFFRDLLFQVGRRLDRFGIRPGSVVVDFGCGPGSYLGRASRLVGERGRVYAVDVHPLAIKSVERRVRRERLANVVPVLSTGYPVAIESRSADVIYALDMFHHIKETKAFLAELHRLLRPDGTLFIESGHQSMDEARKKLLDDERWTILREERNLFVCRPVEQGDT